MYPLREIYIQIAVDTLYNMAIPSQKMLMVFLKEFIFFWHLSFELAPGISRTSGGSFGVDSPSALFTLSSLFSADLDFFCLLLSPLSWSDLTTRPPGLEPGTYGLEIRCSILLSYGRFNLKSKQYKDFLHMLSTLFHAQRVSAPICTNF